MEGGWIHSYHTTEGKTSAETGGGSQKPLEMRPSGASRKDVPRPGHIVPYSLFSLL